jgi:DNA-binding SARP family transcriptional activator
MAVEIRLLGGLEVRLDGVPLDLGTQRARCVLAALLVHHGRTVSSGDLARRAWPGEPPATAEQQVRNYVGQLRRGPLASVAEQLRLQTRRPGYRAELAPGILDIDCFDDLLKRAKRAADTAEPNAAALFREALGLCRGRALDGLDTEYLQARAAILEDRRRDATLAFAELEASAGHYAEAAQALRDLAADRPDDAALHAAYLRAETRQAEEAERPAPPSAHKPLPTDTNAFTGRTAEVEDLLARAAEAGAERSPGATVVCAVDGMAGTGKTALAIHLAHQVAADFRDGQLFIDLHGYTQGLAPRDPKDALAALLQQLGVTSQECPDDLEGRAALYRARLADTATLILLDNALDEAQVAPLIPASEKSMVLITSRARLAALDDAWALSLEGLSVPDSIALFHKIAGPDRAATGGRELIDIVEHCAGLPLAVRIVAALFRNRRWTPAMLLERIGTLDGFSDGSVIPVRTLLRDPRRTVPDSVPAARRDAGTGHRGAGCGRPVRGEGRGRTRAQARTPGGSEPRRRTRGRPLRNARPRPALRAEAGRRGCRGGHGPRTAARLLPGGLRPRERAMAGTAGTCAAVAARGTCQP